MVAGERRPDRVAPVQLAFGQRLPGQTQLVPEPSPTQGLKKQVGKSTATVSVNGNKKPVSRGVNSDIAGIVDQQQEEEYYPDEEIKGNASAAANTKTSMNPIEEEEDDGEDTIQRYKTGMMSMNAGKRQT